LLVGGERMMEGMPVTLCLHEVVFHSPFFRVVCSPPSVRIVLHGLSVVIQRQVWDLGVVTLVEANVLRVADVVVLPVMGSGQLLHSVPHELAIELHEEADQGKIIWRNTALHVPIVLVSERWVTRWLIPGVIAIDSD